MLPRQLSLCILCYRQRKKYSLLNFRHLVVCNRFTKGKFFSFYCEQKIEFFFTFICVNTKNVFRFRKKVRMFNYLLNKIADNICGAAISIVFLIVNQDKLPITQSFPRDKLRFWFRAQWKNWYIKGTRNRKSLGTASLWRLAGLAYIWCRTAN